MNKDMMASHESGELFVDTEAEPKLDPSVMSQLVQDIRGTFLDIKETLSEDFSGNIADIVDSTKLVAKQMHCRVAGEPYTSHTVMSIYTNEQLRKELKVRQSKRGLCACKGNTREALSVFSSGMIKRELQRRKKKGK